MHIAIVYPNLPPKMDGIGDFTACLAQVLAEEHQVTALTGAGEFAPMPGVTNEPLYSVRDTSSFQKLFDWVDANRPDLLLIQYNPFAYGNRGYNPHLPRAVAQIRKQLPDLHIVLMAHESFVPIESAKTAIMTTWQRRQFRSLGSSSDLIMFSSEAHAAYVGEKNTKAPSGIFYVGSNIPDAGFSRTEARRELNLSPDQLVLGFFGTAHPSRPLSWVARSLAEVRASGSNAILLYAGPHGDALRKALTAAGLDTSLLRDLGPQPVDGVSRAFAAMDIYICPFDDGASTRRTTLMTGLQHGIATLSTDGKNTGDLLRSAHGSALTLVPATDEDAFVAEAIRLAADSSERARQGALGEELYVRNFDWSIIAARLLGDILSPARVS
jgi:glycosyltransferase involved in cell wall biosynthesis